MALAVCGGLLATVVLGWPLVAVIGLSQLFDETYEAEFCQLAQPVFGSALLTVAALGLGVAVWGIVRAFPVVLARRGDWRFVRAVALTAVLAGAFVLLAVPMRPERETVDLPCHLT